MHLSVQTSAIPDVFGYEAGYRMIRESGFDAIDWNINHALRFKDVLNAETKEGLCIFERPLEEIMAHFDEELTAIRAAGLTIAQAHAPFPSYDVGRIDALEYTTGIFKQCIRFCSAVGCSRLVIHGISLKFSEPIEKTGEEMRTMTMDMFRQLIPALKETRQSGRTPVIVCMENLFSRFDVLGQGFREGTCSDPHEAVWMIDTLNAEAGDEMFGLCLDTGHLNLLRKDFRTYVPIVGKRIKALHIHDNNQNNDQHLMPYAGNTNWKEFLYTMHGIGYDGDLSFETFAQTNPPRIPRELVPDFLHLIARVGDYFRSEIQKVNE